MYSAFNKMNTSTAFVLTFYRRDGSHILRNVFVMLTAGMLKHRIAVPCKQKTIIVIINNFCLDHECN